MELTGGRTPNLRIAKGLRTTRASAPPLYFSTQRLRQRGRRPETGPFGRIFVRSASDPERTVRSIDQ